MKSINDHRDFLEGDLWGEWNKLDRDQEKGVPPPLRQKPGVDGHDEFTVYIAPVGKI